HERPIALVKTAGGCLLNHLSGHGGHAVSGQLLQRDPFGGVGIRRAAEHATGGPAHEVDEHEMMLDLASRIAIDTVQDLDNGSDFDVETCLFLHFTCDRGFERLPDLNAAAWQTPLAFQRLVTALDQEYAIAVEHNRSNPDDGALRIRFHEPSPRK